MFAKAFFHHHCGHFVLEVSPPRPKDLRGHMDGPLGKDHILLEVFGVGSVLEKKLRNDEMYINVKYTCLIL